MQFLTRPPTLMTKLTAWDQYCVPLAGLLDLWCHGYNNMRCDSPCPGLVNAAKSTPLSLSATVSLPQALAPIWKSQPLFLMHPPDTP